MTVSCPSLSNPESGSVTLTTDGQVTTAVFLCFQGYQISGASSVACQITGQWDHAAPRCG
ncbi:hypothetical protein DPMN_114003 [Dreissena polymorpha]|uniref:Sushi domain-containing protein n=1 Tax=Dreissena polymorpha TaxID=45954 RepID=A0A9D4QRK2_DREPO|nr:hypothetical protein DPMN_114003 [Dreissena polymorpha]